MQKEMIISAGGHETMVAILEEDLVTEIFVERERHRGVVGNIYKGRVSKVLPGMQCAFIDIGLERDGFLYVSDVVDTIEEFDRLDSDDEDEAGGNGKAGGLPAVAPFDAAQGARARVEGAARGGGRSRQRARPGAAAEDRRAAQGRPGDRRPGGQGAARHQRRAADVARDACRPVSRVHADGRSRRRLPQNRVARRAQPPARHRQAVPRGARLRRRRHHPHRGRRASRGRHPERPRLLQRHLEGNAAQVRDVARAGGDLPGAEPGRQAAPRPADRGVLGDPHRQPSGTPARDGPDRAHHAEPGIAGEALHEGLSDLRGVRRPGRNRQGAARARCG